MSGLTDLRARVLLDEAAALGVDLHDLIAAAHRRVPAPTLAETMDALEASFSRATAATYRPYWRLAAELIGDRCLDSLTTVDLQVVVDAAATRAVPRRPATDGRASRESTVAALRAVFGRAHASGIIVNNPAAALSKPDVLVGAGGRSLTWSRSS